MGNHFDYITFGMGNKAAFDTDGTLSDVAGVFTQPGYVASDPQQFNLGEWDIPLAGGLKYGKPTMYPTAKSMKPVTFSTQFAVTNGAFLVSYFGADTYSDPTHTLALKTTGFSTPSIYDVLFYCPYTGGGANRVLYQAIGSVCPRILLSISNQPRYLLASMDWVSQGLVVDLETASLPLVTGAGTAPYKFGVASEDAFTWGSTDLSDVVDSADIVLAKEYAPLTPAGSAYTTDISVYNPLATVAVKAKASQAATALVTDMLAGTARDLTFKIARSATDYIQIKLTSAVLSKWDFGMGKESDEGFVAQSAVFAVECKDAVGDYDSVFAIA